MDVNITRVRIDIPAAVETGFEPVQPQNAIGDFGVRKFRLGRVADGLARFENGPCRQYGRRLGTDKHGLKVKFSGDQKAN